MVIKKKRGGGLWDVNRHGDAHVESIAEYYRLAICDRKFRAGTAFDSTL